MTQNDKLPEEIQEQINDQAEVYANKYLNGKANTHEFGILEEGYIAGATAWAPWKVKHDELMKENERLNNRCNELMAEDHALSESKDDYADAVDAALHKERNAIQAKMTSIETEWAKKCHTLATVLQEFVSKHEAGLLPDRFVYEKAIKILNDGK